MRRPNHASRFEGIAKTKLQASRASDTETLQSQLNKAAKKRLSLSGLEVLHGRLRTVGLWAMNCDFVLLHSQPPVSPSLANTSALRIATIEGGVPTMLFGVSVVTLQLVFTFAMSRTETSVNPPAA